MDATCSPDCLSALLGLLRLDSPKCFETVQRRGLVKYAQGLLNYKRFQHMYRENMHYGP